MRRGAVCSVFWACAALRVLDSCEADCRWKMSQVLGGGINHWLTDTWEERRREKEGAWRVLTLLRKQENRRSPAQPNQSHPGRDASRHPRGGKRGYEATHAGTATLNAVFFKEIVSYPKLGMKMGFLSISWRLLVFSGWRQPLTSSWIVLQNGNVRVHRFLMFILGWPVIATEESRNKGSKRWVGQCFAIQRLNFALKGIHLKLWFWHPTNANSLQLCSELDKASASWNAK